MIFVYYREENYVMCQVLSDDEPINENAIWVDVRNPDEIDMAKISSQLGMQIPTENETWKNHVLNRFYIKNGNAYLNAALITKTSSPHPETAPVTFILNDKLLVTMHDIDPTSFRNFAERIMSGAEDFSTPYYVLEGLMEEIITRVAYNSEIVVETLDDISHNIFGYESVGGKKSKASQKMQVILQRLGAVADLNSKINESLHSLNRMLIFFKQINNLESEVSARTDILSTDVSALTTQTAFLSDKITFQLDALLGMINVEQNLIAKIFSFVAVFFMPPTLISSVYGMNFEFMPELSSPHGYPMAIGMMLIAAIIPFVYFRKKGWL